MHGYINYTWDPQFFSFWLRSNSLEIQVECHWLKRSQESVMALFPTSRYNPLQEGGLILKKCVPVCILLTSIRHRTLPFCLFTAFNITYFSYAKSANCSPFDSFTESQFEIHLSPMRNKKLALHRTSIHTSIIHSPTTHDGQLATLDQP